MLKTLVISQRLVIVFLPWESVLGTADNISFIAMVDLMLFQVLFVLFRLDSKSVFYGNFVHYFSKRMMISFYDFYILNEILL